MRIVIKPMGAFLLLIVFASSLLVLISQFVRTGGKSGLISSSLASASGGTSLAIDNGSFTDGDKLPAGWTNLPWIGQGQAHLFRDTTTSRSAPASLCLEGTTAPTYTAIDHLLSGYQPGQRFRIRGWMRCEGSPKEASLAIRGREMENPIGQQKEYVFISDARSATDWTPFDREITLGDSKYAYFVMVVAGQGKLWVDDVSITPIP